MVEKNVIKALSQNIETRLFSPDRELIPNLDDVYELELAFYENLILADQELFRNGAYFARVGEKYTRHYLMCTGCPLKLPEHSSSRLKSFFQKNIFRTGYSTHGLFPYRGKFHPQMIKGLINAMGIKPGEKVLDPMMGSGTVPVEATFMGIHSVGLDTSPFCRFMAQTKIDALTMNITRAKNALKKYEEVFNYFKRQVEKPATENKTHMRKHRAGYMAIFEPAAQYVTALNRERLSTEARETSDTYNFLLLAYLDSAGYAQRSRRKPPLDLFRGILERYIFVVEKIQTVLQGVESELGEAEILEEDARSLPFGDGSFDGIIFSPPYSFAIDYLDNDSFHLKFLGVDVEKLRSRMIGLRGRNLSEKFELYREDMNKVLAECARVLRKGRICTVVVGTNSNQLSKVLHVPPENVPGLQKILADNAAKHGLKLVKTMSRSIRGISNTMRREYILMLERE